MRKSSGFTLAEVLITLGIIGVVAAMTIPTLMSNTNSAKFRSQFKKTISTLNQAGLMAQAQYDLDFAGLSANCGGITDNPESTMSICGLFNGTLSGHTLASGAPTGYSTKTAAGTTGTPNGYPAANVYTLTMADGSMLIFNSQAQNCHINVGSAASTAPTACRGVIDVNGVTLPNREVNCGGSAAIAAGTCTVASNAANMTDIYPVVFHDGSVEPLTNAARFVLSTSK